MKTTVEELADSRVRLEVEVPEADVKHALEHAASDLAGSIKVPGFRAGKVPLPVVIARVGREALRQEAVRSHIDSWFWNAATSSGIRPVAAPEVQFEDLPAEGDPFRFTATVSVVPRPELADWSALEVPAPDADVPGELVDEELELLRTTVAELAPVEDRPVREGDTVVLDVVGDETGTQRGYVAEVGEGRLVEPLESALVGMSPGETRAVAAPLADERTTSVELTVLEVKEKLLPPLDDELARAASEFETLDELRADIEARLREELAVEIEAQFREDAVDALVAASRVDAPAALVERRTGELWSGLARSLERRGVGVETYLAATGQSQEQVVTRMREEAEKAVKRELALDAVAAKLALEVSDEDVETLIREQAEAAGERPEDVLALMRDRGGFEQLRGDLRLKKALDAVAGGVKRIPVELARAREKLWTPEKEKGGSGMKIWTPGSEEAQ